MFRAVLAAVMLALAAWTPASGQYVVPAAPSTYIAPPVTTWSTNPVVPSQSQKGYYVPRVVPYPSTRPVWVSGYRTRNGTYVPGYWRHVPTR